jgi:DGQHR domain-containing protein
MMTSRKYFGCRVSQRGKDNSVDFFVFVVSAKDIIKWAGIKRVGSHKKGTQRILKESRVRAIQRFLSADVKNTIPVSVVIAFGKSSARFTSLQKTLVTCTDKVDTLNNVTDKVEWGVLSFKFKENAAEHLRPALIVDGQHRLKGIAGLTEEVPVLVVALINASPEEQAFQFVVINNKAAKVPTDNVKAIIASINEQDLQERLLNAGVSYGDISATLKDINDQKTSPFYQLLDWPLNKGQKLVQLTTIEACLRYIRNQFPGLEEDEDTLKDIFTLIWNGIKERYKDLWIVNEKFMSKVNITALNEFVTDRLAFAWEGRPDGY